jgi:hypothetical protein
VERGLERRRRFKRWEEEEEEGEEEEAAAEATTAIEAGTFYDVLKLQISSIFPTTP